MISAAGFSLVAYGINKSGGSTRESPAKRYRLTGAHCFLTELILEGRDCQRSREGLPDDVRR
jgi:hypothetical protein